MDALLSIIIPSKGRQSSLNALIEKIAEQAIAVQHTIELIVVDDGSAPPLQNPKLFANTQWLRLETNAGAPAARKLGFEHSNGKFIHFHDSDDSIAPGWLAALIGNLEQQPTLDFLLSARTVITHEGQQHRRQAFIKRFANKPEKIAQRLHYNNCFGPLGGLTFSRAATQRMRFNDLKSCQDWDMCLDAIHANSHILYDDGFSFIKNDQLDTRISNSLRKKLLGFLQLGRAHKLTQAKCSATRLFYVYSVKHKFPHENHGAFDRLCSKHQLSIYCAFIAIELRKIVNTLT